MRGQWKAVVVVVVAACGGDGAAHLDAGHDGPVADAAKDAAAGEPCASMGGAACFGLPSEVLVGHEGNTMQTPDNSCTRNAQTTTTAITLSGTTVDETGTAVMTSLGVYYAAGFGTADVTTTTAADGTYSVGLPTPVPNEFDVLIQRASAYDTQFLDSQIFFNPTTITGRLYPSVLRSTWVSMLGLIGETPHPADGAILATATDCDGRLLEHAVVTVSSTSSRSTNTAPTFIPGVRVFYLDGTPLVPVGHVGRAETGPSGGFVVLGLTPGTPFYLQSWGFANSTDLGMGMAGLKVTGEKKITIAADVLTSTALTPRSGP